MTPISDTLPENTARDRKREILIILPAAPWPARMNGISIRYYPLIESLARRHHVDLFVHSELRDVPPDDPLIKALRNVTVKHKSAQPPRILDRIITLAEALSPFGEPYRFARYHTQIVGQYLREFTAGRHYDTVLWVMYEYRRALTQLKARFPAARFVYDSIDSPYLLHLREPYEPHAINPWRKYDLWKTRRWERSLLNGVHSTSYISQPDAAAASGSSTAKTEVIPNGIYLAEEPQQPATEPSGPSIGFLGNMAYAPNVQGALALHEAVFLPLKQEFPGLRLAIIGRDPVYEVRTLAAPDVEITGTVKSIWPHIANVGVFVYPMTAGAGLQNKILEAMHAGKPVVTTEICLNSLGAREGEEILVGRTAEELRAHTRALLRDPKYAQELGRRGKTYVDRTFNINQVLAQFERFLIVGDPNEPND